MTPPLFAGTGLHHPIAAVRQFSRRYVEGGIFVGVGAERAQNKAEKREVVVESRGEVAVSISMQLASLKRGFSSSATFAATCRVLVQRIRTGLVVALALCLRNVEPRDCLIARDGLVVSPTTDMAESDLEAIRQARRQELQSQGGGGQGGGKEEDQKYVHLAHSQPTNLMIWQKSRTRGPSIDPVADPRARRGRSHRTNTNGQGIACRRCRE